MPKTYEPIATNTLGSNAATITFSSIPSTYTDLVLVASAAATGFDTPALQFNGDTSTNYSRTFIYGDGSSATSGRNSNQAKMLFAGIDPSISTQFFYIMNYANTATFKTVLHRSGAAGTFTTAIVGLWRKTPEAITSIVLSMNGAQSYSIGSTFTLYGIKAA